MKQKFVIVCVIDSKKKESRYEYVRVNANQAWRYGNISFDTKELAELYCSYENRLRQIPKYKFKVEIRKSHGYTPASIFNDIIDKTTVQFYAVLKGRNGEIVFSGETRKTKYGLTKTIKNLFPNVEIIDKTINKKNDKKNK